MTLIKNLKTISDVGSIVINGVCVPNGYGDCENDIEVYEATQEEFEKIKNIRGKVHTFKNQMVEIQKYDCAKNRFYTFDKGDYHFFLVEQQGYHEWDPNPKFYLLKIVN